jgi:hypothetical protein
MQKDGIKTTVQKMASIVPAPLSTTMTRSDAAFELFT